MNHFAAVSNVHIGHDRVLEVVPQSGQKLFAQYEKNHESLSLSERSLGQTT
jgi:hypothetical protein